MKRLNFISSLALICVLLNSACYKSIEDEDNKKTPVRKTPTATVNNAGSNNSNNSTGDNSSVNNQNTENSSNQTTQNNNTNEIKSGGFNANLPAGFVQPTDSVGKKILREYGAVFLARGGATPPTTVIFKDESEVSKFQAGLQSSTERIGGFSLTLQTAAMNKLKEAIAEAKQSNLSITPRGEDSAKRTYAETLTIWNKRVEPGLKHWVSKGRVSQAEATRIKSLPVYEQIVEILKLEEKGIYFAATLDKPIMYSGAPPGTSQHLAMLALDVKEFNTAKVREILAKHGWFQTVISDEPHFTFLGVKETDLPNLGLKKETKGGKIFWVPEI